MHAPATRALHPTHPTQEGPTTMTTTRRIVDITANLIPGFEAEETSEAKSIAFDALEDRFIPDSGDAITRSRSTHQGRVATHCRGARRRAPW